MGTRGAIGFRHRQEDWLTYNHFDSYPAELGTAFVAFCRDHMGALDALRDRLDQVLVVDPSAEPDPSDPRHAAILEAARARDLFAHVSTGEDWYSALREAQGRLDVYLEIGALPDHSDFPLDSLFCEFAYVLNLDTGEAEFYRGFNKDREAAGRYAKGLPPAANLPDHLNEYGGVALVASWPVTEIPMDWDRRDGGDDAGR